MDAELMQMMARFKLRMRRILDQTVDTYRFVDDRRYAMGVLRLADESDDEDLIIMSLCLSDRLGWLPEPAATSHCGAAKRSTEPTPAKKRYLYGARG